MHIYRSSFYETRQLKDMAVIRISIGKYSGIALRIQHNPVLVSTYLVLKAIDEPAQVFRRMGYSDIRELYELHDVFADAGSGKSTLSCNVWPCEAWITTMFLNCSGW